MALGGKMKSDEEKWANFRKRIFINNPVPDVYNAWAKPANLTTWFLKKAHYFDSKNSLRSPDEFIQTGDRYSWKWHNWDTIEKGNVIEANGIDKISFTFGSGGNVHLSFKSVENGTDVVLVQDEIPTDEESKINFFVGCSTGWTFWLTNLKAWLEFGITLNTVGLSQDQTKDLVNS